MEDNIYSIVNYSISQRYTRDNIAKDFIFKPKTNEWFLIDSQAKMYAEKYLSNLPESILKALSYEGWKIVITDECLELKFGFHYDVYGVTDEDNKTIYVYSYPLAVTYSLAHEIGHFIDGYLGNLSKTADWKRIYSNRPSLENDCIKISYSDRRELKTYYFNDVESNPKEYFANCFLLYTNNKELFLQFDKEAYRVVDRIFENIPFIVELFQKQKATSLLN